MEGEYHTSGINTFTSSKHAVLLAEFALAFGLGSEIFPLIFAFLQLLVRLYFARSFSRTMGSIGRQTRFTTSLSGQCGIDVGCGGDHTGECGRGGCRAA